MIHSPENQCDSLVLDLSVEEGGSVRYMVVQVL